MNNCRLKRLGTLGADIVEANPIVFRGKIYRFEYIRKKNYINKTGDSYFRLFDAVSSEVVAIFGHGFHMGCAFVHDNHAYVSCVDSWGGHEIYLFSSDDLKRWSTPVSILKIPNRGIFNTSICKTDCGFAMVYELDTPEPGDQVFTMYFAESGDLKQWNKIPDAVYG
ncbi:MAG: hypothetical protein LBM70_10285, partial [Victivallales bacterium]|nr:hypothetical protein [Victivallales bacterium]